MNQRRRRRGYVLLMTLVLIALAGLLMVGLARRSLQLALRAADAQQQLQQRWGAVSCQNYAFENANRLLSEPVVASDDRIELLPRRLTSASLQLEMGGIQFDLLLSDEDAKTNLNVLSARRDKTQVYQAIQRLAGSNAHLPIRLRPYDTRDDDPAPSSFPRRRESSRQLDTSDGDPNPRFFGSWGQVFDLANEAGRLDGAASLVEISRQMTCWGRGRLHLAPASDDSLHEVVGLAVSRLKANQLLQVRHEHPEFGVQELLSSLDLTPSEREELQQLLDDNSWCQSLLLTISAAASRETKLVVRETDVEGNVRVSAFAW